MRAKMSGQRIRFMVEPENTALHEARAILAETEPDTCTCSQCPICGTHCVCEKCGQCARCYHHLDGCSGCQGKPIDARLPSMGHNERMALAEGIAQFLAQDVHS